MNMLTILGHVRARWEHFMDPLGGHDTISKVGQELKISMDVYFMTIELETADYYLLRFDIVYIYFISI